jgi:phosphoribosylaminoimidazole carboxylase PurE protein
MISERLQATQQLLLRAQRKAKGNRESTFAKIDFSVWRLMFELVGRWLDLLFDQLVKSNETYRDFSSHGLLQRLGNLFPRGCHSRRVSGSIRSAGGIRPPDAGRHVQVCRIWAARGLRAIIAGAGGAAHLPGMLAAKTTVPVLGVPVASRFLQGLDSLYSIVQMPKGIPVATFAIGPAGAANAALFAVAMLACDNADLRRRLDDFRARQTAAARAMTQDLK